MTSSRPSLAVAMLVALLSVGLPITPAYAEHLAGPDTTPSAPVSGPAPSPVEDSPGSVGAGDLLAFLPDPGQWAGHVFNEVLVSLLQTISGAIRELVGGVMDSSLNFITQTPPAATYESPIVQTLWSLVRGIANAALALVALWGGFNLMVRQQTGSPYHEAMELFPRLVLGALLANTSLVWGQLAIDVNNALCQAVGQESLPGWEQAEGGGQVLVELLAILVYLVAGLLLLLQMLMRLALIDVLLVVSPLALLCWVLPQTHGWARLWSGVYFGAVFTQFVQVLALRLGGALVTELTPQAADVMLLAIFLGVAVLVLTLKIPDLLRHHIDDGLSFARYVAYRQGARAIESRTGGSAGRGGT